MYYVTMKNILISMLTIFSLATSIVSPIFAQDSTTVEEELQAQTTVAPLSTIQIIIIIVAPLCFIALAYILIKKLKL
jgi:uncharacterized membrane protein